MKERIKYFFVIVALFASYTVSAQKFTASASRTKVGVGEQFQISYSLNTQGSKFQAPKFEGFDVYSGPNQSTSVQWINGNFSQSITLSFIIAARQEGKYTIPPASIVVEGNKIESNTLVIEVVKGSPNAQQRGNPNQPSTPTENIAENLFVKTFVSKTKAYQGEQISITQKVYTRLNLRGFQDIKFPSYNGFWSQDVPQGQINLTTENVDGVMFNVAEVKRTFVFAQRSGTLEIEPIEIECVVRQKSSKRAESIFDEMFGMSAYEDAVYKIKSKPVKIEIMPLPENGKPEKFSGAVGIFSFKAQLDKENLKANEAANVKIQINGKGNIKLIEAPEINKSEDIESYDPKANENIEVNTTGVNGTKSFEYLLIPRTEGSYDVSPLSFNYFDPEKKTYVNIPAPQFKLNVAKGAIENNTPIISNGQNIKEEVKQLANDIRYIKTNHFNLKEKNTYLFGTTLYYSIIGILIILFCSFLYARRKYISQNKNIVLVKSRRATKIAKKRLVIAQSYLKGNKKDLFYDEIFKALYGYMSDKLSIPVADLSKENISSALTERKIATEIITKLNDTLSNCEYARYAPSAVSSNLEEIYNSTVDLISNIEENIA